MPVSLGRRGDAVLPARVLNTLNLGREMAVRLETGEPGWTTWMLVRPVVSRDSTWDALRRNWTLTREASRSFEPPNCFVVRYTRLSEAHLEAERHGDLDIAMQAN